MTAGFFLSREAALYSDCHIDTEFLLSASGAFIVFVAAAVAALHRYFHQLKQKKLFYPMLGYIAVLGIMASLATASGIRTGGAPGAAAAAGGICFAVSDILLGRNRLGKRRSCPAVLDMICNERIKKWRYFRQFTIYSGAI